MDKNSRVVFALLILGFAVFRLVRYVQLGTARRRISAIPSTTVPVPITPSEVPRSADLVPTTPPAGSISAYRRTLGTLTAVSSWLIGNGLFWAALFGFQYLDGIPVFWRLFLGVLANFYLFRFSKDIGKRVSAKSDTLMPPVSPPS